MIKKTRLTLSALLLLTLLAACRAGDVPDSTLPGSPTLVATTTLIGDVVTAVGGDAINLSVLLAPGADPHSFDPTPQDAVTLADADVIFINGLGLEQFLGPTLQNAGGDAKIVAVSDGVETIARVADDHDHEEGGIDPHTWTDPNNVMIWVENIARALIELNPEQADSINANAAAYKRELTALDAWIRAQVAEIPESDREIVTDHTLFGYFAERYGFRQVGAIVPGYSTLAEPSAQELAALEDAIAKLGVKAVFVGNTVNPKLAERVAADTGVRLVTLYTGSLSAADGPAPTYLDYMRSNVTAIIEALR